MLPRTYRIQEAAEFLKVSKSHVSRAAARGDLKGYKPGRSWVFLEEDLMEYLQSTQPFGAIKCRTMIENARSHSPSSISTNKRTLDPLMARIEEAEAKLRAQK